MRPLVSLLIPCYNAERYVAEAIESALAQTWPNKEIIVVDDGSTDGSRDVLNRFMSRGVKVRHQRNRGQSAAANSAFRHSSGDYIKFFDADDLIHPRLIEQQVERLKGSATTVASAEWGRFYDDDLATFMLNPESVWRDMNSLDWLIEAWMKARPMMQCALWLLPRQILDRTGLWNEDLSLINDFEFFSRVLCEAEEVRFAPSVPVYYRSGLLNSLSGQRTRAAVESAGESLLLGTRHLLLQRDDLRAKKACANVLQDFIYTYYPDHSDLCATVAKRVHELGGSDLAASGPPRFEKLRNVVGWRMAKRIQRLAYRAGYKPGTGATHPKPEQKTFVSPP